MKLFVGLGNPGASYARHRHNIGFMAVDAIAAAHGFGPWRAKFQGQIAEGRLGPEQVLLLKPGTYMNLSGDSVRAAMGFYKLEPADVVVFHDELDLAPGRVRVKTGGGTAGHNGLRSLGAHIGPDFTRVRIGIGHPGDKRLVSPPRPRRLRQGRRRLARRPAARRRRRRAGARRRRHAGLPERRRPPRRAAARARAAPRPPRARAGAAARRRGRPRPAAAAGRPLPVTRARRLPRPGRALRRHGLAVHRAALPPARRAPRPRRPGLRPGARLARRPVAPRRRPAAAARRRAARAGASRAATRAGRGLSAARRGGRRRRALGGGRPPPSPRTRRFLLARLDGPPQTNEPQRSAALAPGFLTVAALTGLPLVTSEIGASAGLNLIWDRFAYGFGAGRLGRPGLAGAHRAGLAGPAAAAARGAVAERAGCDRAPPDLGREADRLRLLSFVWADQAARLARTARRDRARPRRRRPRRARRRRRLARRAARRAAARAGRTSSTTRSSGSTSAGRRRTACAAPRRRRRAGDAATRRSPGCAWRATARRPAPRSR